MFIGRKRKFIKELNLDKINTTNQLKSYEKAIDGLNNQKVRLKGLTNISNEEYNIQINFIESKLNEVSKGRTACAERLKELNKEYERIMKK